MTKEDAIGLLEFLLRQISSENVLTGNRLKSYNKYKTKKGMRY